MVGNGPFLAEKPNFEKAIEKSRRRSTKTKSRGAGPTTVLRRGQDAILEHARAVQNRRTRAVKKRGSTGAHVPFRRGDYPGSPGYRSTPAQNVTRRPSVDDFNIDVLFFRALAKNRICASDNRVGYCETLPT